MDKSLIKQKNRLSDEYWRARVHKPRKPLSQFDRINKLSVLILLTTIFILITKVWIYQGENEVHLQLPSFSGNGSGSGGRREEEMTEELVYLTNEINFAPPDDLLKTLNRSIKKHQRSM